MRPLRPPPPLCILILLLSSHLACAQLFYPLSGDVHFEKVRLSLPSPPLVGNFAGFELYKRIEQGPVLNTITVDGDFSDWAAVKELTRHPMPPEDQAYLQKAWITHNETHFFARIRAAESYWDSQVQILIDVDSNASTGYARRGLFIGADYRINIDFFGVVLGRYNVSYDMADAEFYSLWTVFAEANVIMGDDGSALNGVEIAVPLALLNYTGLPDVFGCDVFFKVSLDTFPTVGYARGTPYKVMYGFHKVSEDLLPSRSTFVDKDVVGAVTYEYVVVAVEKTGKKYVWDRITLYVPYAHARDFNAWVTSTTSFAMNWTYPEDTDVAWVRVVRNEDWFPDNYTDGVTIYEGMGTNYWEKDMVPGKKYYWAIFSTDGLGNWSKSWWDCEDHSVATVIHGPLPVLNTSDYTVYFSAWDAKLVRMAEKYDMVILHPGAGSALITADQVADIKDGLDNVLGTEDDVIVIGYISVGEDYGQPNPLTPGFNDPRTNLGSMNDGRGPLWYDWKTGQRHYENKGQPSFYLDMYRYAYNDRGMRYGAAGQDDFPDQNTEWGGLYVDPGNTDWWQFLRSCTYETYGAAGFDYIMKTLKMDGVFLDTVGVSAPWSYWDPPSYLGDYFWVRDGALDLMANIALWYPGAYIIPNRPMHFCYPEFAAKRYDDFRTVVNGIYWESYSADMEFWWRGNNGRIFEKVVIAGQDNHDGRGFTTIILDYFAVMIQAVETGEYELSPWYERTSDQARRTEPLNYITHVSPSRSLAEVDDYIYLYHHPEHFGGLPDWHVMYIIAPRYGAEAKAVKWPTYRDSTGARTRCNITIAVTNRGINATKPATVHIKHNDLWLQDEIVPPMPTETKYEFVRTIILYDIGNNLHVDITTDEPEYTDENNHWDNQIDLYFHLMAGHIYKHPILPDLFVPRAEFDPPMPLVSKELTMTVYQTNQGPGVATSTRLFIWLGNHAGGGQVGNVHTPYMMPNDTKSVTFAYNLTGFGSYNVGFTVDAVVRVPQSNRTNDNTNLRFFAYSHDQPVADWTAARAESHAMFITNTISRSDLPYRINSIWITHNGTHVFLRFAMSAPLDLIDQTLFLYINSDRDWSTGYGTTLGADYSVYNAIPQRFTGGADQDGWHWKMILDVPSELAAEGGDTSLIGFTLNATSIGIDLADDHAYAMFYMTLSDKEGMRDEYPRAGTFFTYPPSCFDGSLNQNEVGVDCGGVCTRECGRIVIDGRFDDWSAYPNKPLVANTSVTPEEGTLAPACRQLQSWLTFDVDFLYLRIAFEGAIDRSVCNYYVLLSSPTRVGGYAASSGALNASVLVTNFASLAAFSGAVETEWAWTPQPDPVYNVIGSGAEANTIEIAIPRPALGWSSSDQTVSLVVQSVDTRNSLDWTSHVTQVMPQFGAVFHSETCFDLVYNNRETAVDCGGPECDACPRGITLDGYFADWPLATTVTKDRKQDGFVTVLDKQVATSIARCADLSMAATFSTTEWFYIMVRTWKGNPRDKQCVLEIAIDSDRNTKSGYPYKLGDVGADYRWVDGRMYQYIGNGKNWMWTELFNVTQIEYGKDPTFGMEIAISGQLLPRANTKAFIIYCDTRNTVALADDGLDYWPEPNPKAPICGDFVRNGLETGVDCGAYCSPCATGVSLTDDTVVDWLQVPNPPVLAFEAEHQGDGFDASGKLHAISSSADIKWGHLSVNDTWVCVHLGLYGPYDVSVADYSMFFDTDGDAVTGYAASGGKVGAEWMWSSPGVVSQYTGAGSDWSWLVMEQEPSESLRSQVVDDDVEVCMTRRLIALPESRFNTSIALSFVAVDRVGSTNWRDHITDTFPTPGFAWRYSLDPQRPTSATATGAFMIPPDLSFKVLPLIIVAVLLFVSVLVAVVISYLYHVIKNAEPVTLPVRASSSRTTVPRAYSRLNEDYL